jgi:hypothetical protein
MIIQEWAQGRMYYNPPMNELHRILVRLPLSSTFFNANFVRARSIWNGPFMKHPCIASRITPQDFNASTVLSLLHTRQMSEQSSTVVHLAKICQPSSFRRRPVAKA